jgi:hypothetical protein
MLLELKKEIKNANGQIILRELSQKLNVQPSVIEGMLLSLYGKDVLKNSMQDCSSTGACPACGKNCPFVKTN